MRCFNLVLMGLTLALITLVRPPSGSIPEHYIQDLRRYQRPLGSGESLTGVIRDCYLVSNLPDGYLLVTKEEQYKISSNRGLREEVLYKEIHIVNGKVKLTIEN